MTVSAVPVDTAPPTAAVAPEPAPVSRTRWEYPTLAVLLVVTGLSYLYNLGANGWANSFYSAAIQAGSQSWKAFFFGSSDAANSITVDKPPASLWVMELSVRLFGLSTWSILVPQVLLGVGTVALLWFTVRRSFGPAAGLIAGAVLAVTPVAALMFRFNNPDALLVFLMVAAGWALLRAVADGRWRRLVLTGAFIGLGFLAKQLQVLLVVPPLALTYLIAGPPKLGKRLAQLFAAGAAMVVSAGWWLLAVELWPASSRPWIGGSQNNSIIELTLGYNGLGRLNGKETGSVGPGGELPPGGNGMWGQTGITRMFEPAQGGQIAWLVPAALVALVAGLLVRGRAARTDGQRAALILWGGWLVVTGLVFSFMAGIFHQYYTVALAPAIAALIGMGAVLLWRNRSRWWVRFFAALAVGLTTATAWMLLSRSAEFLPWLRWAVLVGGIFATVAILLPLSAKSAAVAALIAGAVALAGPVAYTVETLNSAHQGSIPTAGPNVRGGFPGGPGGFPEGMAGNGLPPGPGGAAPGMSGAPGGFGLAPGADGQRALTRGGDADGMRGGPGGLLGASEPGEELVALLGQNSGAYAWVAAAVGSNSASGYQLATELPVMPIGGFNGSDPSPTLEQFRQYVDAGRIHYFLGGGRGGPGGGEAESNRIAQWVQANFTATEVDGVQVYDLTAPR